MKKILLYTFICVIIFHTDINTLEDVVSLNEQNNIQTKSAFAGLMVFDDLTAKQMVNYGPVSIDGATLPVNTPALIVHGNTIINTLIIEEIQNVYGTSPTSPIQDLIVNANGTLGSTEHAGGGGTVTSVTGINNIIVTNPTTNPVISLSPNVQLTSATASGAVNANSVSANSATINGSVTANSITATSLSGSSDKIVTVGAGGALSTTTLVGANAIVITQTPGNITIANEPLFQCDSGSASPINNSITFTATSPGSTLQFVGSGSTVSFHVTDGNSNTLIGPQFNFSGSQKLAIGTGIGNTATGSITIGYAAIAPQNSITIGSLAEPAINNTTITLGTGAIGAVIRLPVINDCFIGGIYGVSGTGNAISISEASGEPQLFAPSSSRHYKENITPLPAITNTFMQLHPVSFSYIKDEAHTKHLGFIAEEVEPLFPEMIIYDKDGRVESICAQFFNPILVKMAQEQETAICALTERKEQLSTDLQELKQLLATIMVDNKE